MPTNRKIASITLLALAFALALPSGARAGDPIRSLHDAQNEGQRIQRYIDDFNAWSAQRKAAPDTGLDTMNAKANPSSWIDAFNADIDETMRRHEHLERPSEALATEIAAQTEGGTKARRLLAKMTGFGKELAMRGSQTYSETLAYLLADYYQKPQDRDAIHELLQQVSAGVAAEAHAPYRDPVLERMSDATMYAWTLLVIWDWRGGIKGLATDGRSIVGGAGRGWEALVARVRKLPRTAAEIELSAAKAAESSEKTSQAMAKELEELRNPRFASLKALPKKALSGLKGHAVQLGKAFLVGGVPGALYGLDEQSQPVKVDPLKALKTLQAFAILDLETQVLDLDQRTQNLLAQARPNGKQLDLKNILSHADDWAAASRLLADLKAQYDHLHRSAPEFEGQVPWPELASQVQRVRQRNWIEKIRMPQELRQAAFVERSTELSNLVDSLTRRFRQEAIAHGIGAKDDAFVSLMPIDLKLSAVEFRLKALAAALSSLKLAP